ncbi:MAG: 16S rRNA (guanine(527)-N(7))-methyltransferase RsmG [Eubacterium sp.]|nr:16S rRNA (guanine(527)-N(7))-methyltransferase RsmG [Eubacterium sp.]
MEKYQEQIKSAILEEAGLELTDIQAEQFFQYYRLLDEWNKVMNLTAITEFDQVLSRHFAESLSLISGYKNTISEDEWKTLPDKHLRVIDVGTGAGFPGIPLAIAFPNWKFTLLDSLTKRITFLNEVVSKLGLTNVEIVNGRAEEFGRNPVYREKYNFVVSRAVANLAVLSEYCIPFAAKGGYFVPYKGDKVIDEEKEAEKAVKVLGGKIINNYCYPDHDGIERYLVFIKKTLNTPKKYPRKNGIPKKTPIK